MTSTLYVKAMTVLLLDQNLFLLGYVIPTIRTRYTKARVGGGRCLAIHVWVVLRRMKRWIRNARWVGFYVHVWFSLDANVDMVSSTTGRKRGSSDSRVFNVFFIVSKCFNCGAFLV